MSRVQLLVMDDAGEFRHGLGRGETVFDEAMRLAGHPLAAGAVDDASGLDLTVPAERVPEIAGTVREAVRAVQAAVSTAETEGAYDRAEIEVLGETVPIRVRNDQHLGLKHLNQLYEVLRDTAAAGRGLTVYSVPRLDELDRAILAETSTEALARSALPAALAARREHLLSLGAPAEMLTDLDDPAPGTIDAHLDRLERWNLVSRTPAGDIGPTRKRSFVRF